MTEGALWGLDIVELSHGISGAMCAKAMADLGANVIKVERMCNYDPNMAPHNVYPCCGHDQWAAIAVGTDQEWQAMCEAMSSPELKADSRFSTSEARKANEHELDQLISEWTTQHSPREVMGALQQVGVAAGPVMGVIDLMQDPHLLERGYVVEMDHPEVGPRTVAGLPAMFGAMPELAYLPAPLLGLHNQMVLGELIGIDDSEFERLVNVKAIY